MSEYGDTTFLTTTVTNKVTRDSPLRQNESKFNLLLNIAEYNPDGSLRVADSKGYLELSILRHTSTVTPVGLHLCNQDDRRHSYDGYKLG